MITINLLAHLGREIDLSLSLEGQDSKVLHISDLEKARFSGEADEGEAQSPIVLTVVRKVLLADGWQVSY